MEIDGTQLNEGRVYVIAEAGVNHDGDPNIAKKLIEVAANAGADAVKFQTFDADRLVTGDGEKAEYAIETTDENESQRDMLRRYELSDEDHYSLKEHCERHGITFLSTPFDSESADLLDDLDTSAIKLGSGELTNKPLLEHIAGFGRPMIVSTGMATMAEIRDARGWIEAVNAGADVAFLHCTSEYPTAMEDVNLRAMATMIEKLPEPIGYSDHTMAVETPGLAVAAGARIVEKHFTLDSTRPGPDHEASLEPDELQRCVEVAREAAITRGSAMKKPTLTERQNRHPLRKSLHAKTAIPERSTFTDENVSIKRPADGLPPSDLNATLGKIAARDLTAGDPITESCVWEEEP
jgi:N-acetylneuraminate synthase/N,N'-diacetyllegionaminate synthase